METIIGLLIVILPIIFKFIGKKLEQAAQDAAPQVQPVEDWTKELRRHMEAQQHEQAPLKEQVVVEPLAVDPVASKPNRPGGAGQKTKRRPKKPVLNEEPQKKREKIDVKKMIVYSEIMKPKCMD